MATILWSSLVNGATPVFNPNSDVLRFDDSTISAASVRVRGTATTAEFSYAGKTITLGMNWFSITTTNVTFDNGSLLLVGDNTTGTTGDDSNNALPGGLGNDQLIGMGGDDLLAGGDGNDVFLMAGSASTGAVGLDTLIGGNGQDRIVFVDASGGVTIGSATGVERMVGTTFNDTFTTIAGFTVEGGAGNDTFVGNAANGIESSLSYESAAGPVNVNLGTGTASDGLGGTDTFSNIDGVEGSSFNDVLTGGSDSRDASGGLLEFFQGMAGNDTIDGVGGVDRADYTFSPGGVVVDLGLGTAQDGWGGTDTLLNIEQARGSAFADTLRAGVAGGVFGMGGDDTLIGGAGNNVLSGDEGTDLVTYADAGAAVMLDLGLGTPQNTVGAGVDTLAAVEYAIGSAFNDQIIGNTGANVLTGGGGNDTILGGLGDDWLEGDASQFANPTTGVAGNDYLQGDEGNDTFLAGPGDDTVHGNTGNDTIVGGAGNDVLYGDEENDALDGRDGSDTLYGGIQVDVLFGDADSDSLFGGDGNDVMMGERGEDNVLGALDVLHGEAGNDELDGGAGDDWIYGGDGNDVITGDHGNDLIVGGPGAEIMRGSAANAFGPATVGNDLFVYTSIADAGDRIWGFDTRPGDGDGLDLRSLFDSAGYAGNTPRDDGFLYVFQNSANTDIYVDLNGSAGGANLTRLVTLESFIATNLTDSYFLYQ